MLLLCRYQSSFTGVVTVSLSGISDVGLAVDGLFAGVVNVSLSGISLHSLKSKPKTQLFSSAY